MPKVAKELKALEVSRLNEPGMHAVGGVAGLHLNVAPSGARSWILRVMVGAKRREVGLGGYPTVTLATAREAARAMRQQIAEGEDPVLVKTLARQRLIDQQNRSITFEEAARRFLAAKQGEWRNAKHAAQWGSTLKTYAHPILGKKHVSTIELTDVLQVLEPIWQEKNETASRLRGRIESVLDWAKVHGYAEGENAARWKGNLDKVLPRPSKVKRVKHHEALPYAQIGDFLSKLAKRSGSAAAALEFLILTAARSGEVRRMTWGELASDDNLWIVPSERMKAGKEHRVPLSEGVLAVLERQRKLTDSDDPAALVFPSPNAKKHLSDVAFKQLLKRLGYGHVTAHGFRSTFRDWAGEQTQHPREVMEHALAHQLKDKAEAAYARGTLLQKRRKLMNDWAAYCSGTTEREEQTNDSTGTPEPTAQNSGGPSRLRIVSGG
ncbi:tyrosine-type recombinase/integrase [Pseudohaliea rubra]|uniref:tyrosine-type recombinase/integrase n=1 Tax=Pseudohaliea rubra TaxID=475795 RepID=UPI000A04D9AF|nr:site-specific integrase [Pseudohaliea rubra]